MQALAERCSLHCSRPILLLPPSQPRSSRHPPHTSALHKHDVPRSQPCVVCASSSSEGAQAESYTTMHPQAESSPQAEGPPTAPEWTLQRVLQALRSFFVSCLHLLPQLSAPSLPDALKRLGLVLAASMLMIVVLTSIDSACLWLYLTNARRIA